MEFRPHDPERDAEDCLRIYGDFDAPAALVQRLDRILRLPTPALGWDI